MKEICQRVFNLSGEYISMSSDGCLGTLLNELMQDPLDIDIDKIRLLVRWGADPNTRSKDGLTCLHLALQ